MDKLGSAISQKLNVETVFRIGPFPVSESVVISWVVIAVFFLLVLVLTRNMSVMNPSRRQIAVESFVEWIRNLIVSMTGENGACYWEYLATVLLYIGLSNMVGIFGLKSPTKDINVSGCLAVMSIILVEAAGIRHRGAGGWLKSFTKPIAIITPINILEIFIRPLSLCMRLFGNVLGAFIIMEMIKLVLPVVAPALLSLYFDLFDGLIQAYVFVFLTSLYIREAVEDE